MEEGETRKIVLLGIPLVGKTSVIQVLRDLKGAEVRLVDPGTPAGVDRGVAATWSEGGRRFEVSTLAGAVWDFASWRAISPLEAKAIFMIDIRSTCSERNLAEQMLAWWSGLGPPAAIQITKADLASEGRAAEVEDFQSHLERRGLPCFISRHDRPLTQIEACCHVLECELPAAPSFAAILQQNLPGPSLAKKAAKFSGWIPKTWRDAWAKKKKFEWCCIQFQLNYAEAGRRGFGIVVKPGAFGGPMFKVQHRCLEPGAAIPDLEPGVALSVISEMVLHQCPWCGKNLQSWYSPWAAQLFRPELEMEHFKASEP